MLHIFTDSLTTLPNDLIKQLNIGIVPVYVVFSNTEIYKHTVDIQTGNILGLVMETGKVPGIAAPTVEDLVQLFRVSLSKNDHVLFISMSAEVSSTYRNAEAAAKHFPNGQVTVIDSTHFSTGTAMMILQASRLSKAAKKINILRRRLEEYRVNIKEELLLDKIQLIKPSGNIYGLSNRIISPLKLRPQLDVKTGCIRNALKNERNPIKMQEDNIDRDLIVISQTLASDPGEHAGSKLNKRYSFKEVIFTSNITGLLCRKAPRSLEIGYLLKPADPLQK
jgi:DegV family protein with EDD domain